MIVRALIHPEEEYRRIKEKIRKDPELQARFKAVGIDLKNPPYLEFDTGGQLDEVSEAAKESLRKALENLLVVIGQILLQMMNMDMAFWGKNLPPVAAEIVVDGLKEIDDKLDKQMKNLRSLYESLDDD